MEERSLAFEIDSFRCLVLVFINTKEMSTSTTYWEHVESDEDLPTQETYDQLVYEHLRLKKMIVRIDHSENEKEKDHLDLSSHLLNVTHEGKRSLKT